MYLELMFLNVPKDVVLASLLTPSLRNYVLPSMTLESLVPLSLSSS